MSAAMAVEPKRMSFKARVNLGGVEYYLGQFPTAEEARQREHEAREEFRRTGAVTSVSVRDRRVPIADHGDVYLWYWSHFQAGRLEATFEESLMIGVMRDAVVERLKSPKARERAEARRWIMSDDRSHIFSFASIADHFSIDVSFAREALLR